MVKFFIACHSCCRWGDEKTANDSVNWGRIKLLYYISHCQFGWHLGSYFGGAKSNSFHLTWPSLSISGGDDPFSTSLSATPTLSGALDFNSSYFGALNSSTVSLAFNPSLPMSGQVGVDLGRASARAATTVDEPSASTAASVIGQPTLNFVIDFKLDLEGSIGDGVGQMGATVDCAPGAPLTLPTGHASFSTTKQHPVVSTQMPSGWDSLAPQASLTLTATPSITLTAGPTIPDSIPYVEWARPRNARHNFRQSQCIFGGSLQS